MSPQVAADIVALVDEFSPPRGHAIDAAMERVVSLSRRALTARSGDPVFAAYNAAVAELHRLTGRQP